MNRRSVLLGLGAAVAALAIPTPPAAAAPLPDAPHYPGPDEPRTAWAVLKVDGKGNTTILEHSNISSVTIKGTHMTIVFDEALKHPYAVVGHFTGSDEAAAEWGLVSAMVPTSSGFKLVVTKETTEECYDLSALAAAGYIVFTVYDARLPD